MTRGFIVSFSLDFIKRVLIVIEKYCDSQRMEKAHEDPEDVIMADADDVCPRSYPLVFATFNPHYPYSYKISPVDLAITCLYRRWAHARPLRKNFYSRLCLISLAFPYFSLSIFLFASFSFFNRRFRFSKFSSSDFLESFGKKRETQLGLPLKSYVFASYLSF